MGSPPFTVIELKNTHHILGVLSRDADSAGGNQIALLAPESLTVRAPVEFATTAAPPDPPFEMQVPSSLLNAVTVSNLAADLRREVFSDPLACVIAEDGTAGRATESATNAPVLTLNATNGRVETFKLDIKSTAGKGGVAYTLLIREAKPLPNKPPFRSINQGVVAENQSDVNNVQITLVPGQGAPVKPIPSGTNVHVLLAVAGHPLQLSSSMTP